MPNPAKTETDSEPRKEVDAPEDRDDEIPHEDRPLREKEDDDEDYNFYAEHSTYRLTNGKACQ